MDSSDGELNNPKTNKPIQTFFTQMFGQDTDVDCIALDHCYTKPWNGHPDSLRVKPAKMLFMKGIPFHPGLDGPCLNEKVDVETVTTKHLPLFDNVKAHLAMNECDRFTSVSSSKNLEDWEECMKRISLSWTEPQNSLFNKTMKIVQSDRLARLAYDGNRNEPVLRRLAVDKSALRMRHLFGSVGWDMKQLQWLHNTLTDYLDKLHLSVYIDILQSLKAKVPNLIDKLLVLAKNGESLQNVLKRPWDPISSLFTQQKPRKLPGSPILVLAPGDPPLGGVGHPRRLKFWHSQLSALGKVVTLHLHIGQTMSIGDSLETVMLALKNKLMELKNSFPLRPLVLVGWTVGALIACQVALIEGVTAVVCLGFPLTGVLGSRGDLDDPLLESCTPTLFVIGQNACMCSVDDMEDFRERMRAESGLVVIGGGDDHLRVARLKRKLEGITQSMVDRCILDEIGAFLSSVLSQPLEESPQFLSLEASPKKESKVKKKNKVKEVKITKRQYNKKQPRKNSVRVVERMSPSSPGSSTTDTSSTCSIGDAHVLAHAWTKPKRGVGRPPLSESAPRKKRPKREYYETTFARTSTPIAAPLPAKRPIKTPDIFNNYLMDPQRISVNIGTMSSLSPLRHSPPNASLLSKVAPPTIPSAGVSPKLGSFEAPRGFIARMDVPHANTSNMLTSSQQRMVMPRGKPKNVSFVTSPVQSGITTSYITSPTVNMITSSSAVPTSAETQSENKTLLPRQLILQKKIMDINQIQSLIMKNQTKPSQTLQLLSSGNKAIAQKPSDNSLYGVPQAKTSLLQTALVTGVKAAPALPHPAPSLQTPPPPKVIAPTLTPVPRKMQVITFLKPPPSPIVSKPAVVTPLLKDLDRDASGILHPKVMRTYGDIKLNRQLAALKQQQQGFKISETDTFSADSQEAALALAQLAESSQDSLDDELS